MASPSTAVVAEAAADAASQAVYDNLLFPLWVGLLLGAIGYIVKLVRQRSGIRTALVADINAILPLAQEIKQYLQNGKHEWLVVGNTLTGSPVATGPSTMLFTALLPELYLLPKKEIQQILSFYRHHELCESLTRSLYERIALLAQAGQPLTSVHVNRLRVRCERVCAGYNSLLSVKSMPIKSISELPTIYPIPSTLETWQKLIEQDPAATGGKP